MDYFVSIQLDRNSKIPLYQQLADALYDLISKDILKANTKLPTIRKLANKLKVNNVTVINAYKYLEKKGLVYSQVGSGTYVSPIPVKDMPSPAYEEKKEIKQIMITEDSINFASISPSTDLFPVESFKCIVNEILDKDKGNAFSYQESQGYEKLRESVADYLKSYRINSSKDRIQIISGAQQGIDILSKALLQYGDTLLVEKPTYHGAIAAFQSRGARIIEVPLETDGMDLEILENYLKIYHPKFIYLMPYYQNPTGYSYSLKKKRTILDLAEKYNTYIIEDDYLSDLNYSEEKSIPVKALDHRNRVIFLKSFSKILMPGLRLGFLVVPKNLLDNILSAKQTTDITTSGFIQRVFDLYLRKGLWKSHINEIREIYKKRYIYLMKLLDEHLKNEISYIPPDGGLSLWIKLKASISVDKLSDILLSRNVIISPGSLFSLSKESLNYFRLSFAAVNEKQIHEGILILKEVLNNMNSDPASVEPIL